jgi:hypothetical protein
VSAGSQRQSRRPCSPTKASPATVRSATPVCCGAWCTAIVQSRRAGT